MREREVIIPNILKWFYIMQPIKILTIKVRSTNKQSVQHKRKKKQRTKRQVPPRGRTNS